MTKIYTLLLIIISIVYCKYVLCLNNTMKIDERELVILDFLVDEGINTTSQFPLYKPVSLDSDSDGNLYLLDAGNYCLVKYSPKGKYLKHWGSKGTGPGEFFLEGFNNGIFIDKSNLIYSYDDSTSLINIFNTEGLLIKSFRTEKAPQSLVVDNNGQIYITQLGIDKLDKLICVYDKNGKKLNEFGDVFVEGVKSIDNCSYITIYNETIYQSFLAFPFIRKYDKRGILKKEGYLDFSKLISNRKIYDYWKICQDKKIPNKNGNYTAAFSRGIKTFKDSIYIDGSPDILIINANLELIGYHKLSYEMGNIFIPMDLNFNKKTGDIIRIVKGSSDIGIASFENHKQ